MTKPLVLLCAKRDGTLWYGNGTAKDDTRQRKLLKAAITHLPEGAYELTIKPVDQTRRSQANRYYWGVVLRMMAEESGHGANELHDLMKLRHNGQVITDITTGEEVTVGRTTRTLTVAQFSAYLEAVMLDGAEYLGLTFPSQEDRG
jgi:hypothetical protein